MDVDYKNANSILLSIKNFDEWGFQGGFTMPFLKGQIEFEHPVQFIHQANLLMDQVNFPQRSFERKVIYDDADKRNYGNNLILKQCNWQNFQRQCDKREAVKATFVIWVLYRQNASWQGELRGSEIEKVCFRSVVELLDLISQVITYKYLPGKPDT